MELQQVKDITINFILATPRTGSTLLASMLNTHPNIISTVEEPFAYNLYPKYKNKKNWTTETIKEFCYDFYLFSEGKLELQFGTKKDLETILENYKPHLTADIAIRLIYLCFYPTKDKSQITTIVDKQLRFHSCLKQLISFYPQSKFVILYRDPRDQSLAKFRMLERKDKHKDYYRIAHSWEFVYDKLWRLKSDIGNERFLEIKYEDFVSNTEYELKKICLFLGVMYNEIMLSSHEKFKEEFNLKKDQLSIAAQSRISLSHQGLSQKIYTDKVGFWKQGLKAEEANLIWTICGSLAEKIGYKKDEHFIKKYASFKNWLTFLSISKKRIMTTLYYSSPFFLKYQIKKIKYGKHFKNDDFSSEEFLKRTYNAD